MRYIRALIDVLFFCWLVAGAVGFLSIAWHLPIWVLQCS